MSAIQLTPEAVTAVNALCDPSTLEGHIAHLGNAEDALQRAAYDDDELHHLFRYAYELKLMREQFEQLQQLLGYKPDD